jgi:diacylglycerol kinase family enzyme
MPQASRRPPAVLIVNPNAGRLSEGTREGVIAALRSRFRLEALSTTARDTGIELAAEAADAGHELVIAFGGDGHVNEVVNGVAGTDSSLGIIPGGTMNVFARALGIDMDPFKAIERLHEIAEGPSQIVSLGQMGDRYFTFSAGCGFDAEAAERVERYVPAKRRMGQLWFYWSAVRVLSGTYRHRSPSMLLRGPFGQVPVAMGIACNVGPYAYLGDRPVILAPRVTLERGLDIFALRSMRVQALPLYAYRVLASDLTDHPDVFYESDLDWFELSAPAPFSRHVDGEPLPPSRVASFRSVPGILKVKV